jgi:hypothetical protein
MDPNCHGAYGRGSPCEGHHDGAADQDPVGEKGPHQPTRLILALVIVYQLIPAAVAAAELSNSPSGQQEHRAQPDVLRIIHTCAQQGA